MQTPDWLRNYLMPGVRIPWPELGQVWRYCSGAKECARRRRQLARGIIMSNITQKALEGKWLP